MSYSRTTYEDEDEPLALVAGVVELDPAVELSGAPKQLLSPELDEQDEYIKRTKTHTAILNRENSRL